MMVDLIFRWDGKEMDVDWPKKAPIPRKSDYVILPDGRSFRVEKVTHCLTYYVEDHSLVKTYIDVHATDGSTPHRPV